jgi:hypothetical protein
MWDRHGGLRYDRERVNWLVISLSAELRGTVYRSNNKIVKIEMKQMKFHDISSN